MSDAIRRRLRVRGRVQGVGFRPFVHRIATGLGVYGHVGNDPTGVFIEVEGPTPALDDFARLLRDDLPAIARITSLEIVDIPVAGDTTFEIRRSVDLGAQSVDISPDIATCDDCLSELQDAADRRHQYPFINCTNCGPRYSIVGSVPYDRARTTMARFTMCPDCQKEYDDPGDRRFHAQPDACAVCGPQVWLAGADGERISEDGILNAASMLIAGHIIAIKGLGGFHLACRADSDESVGALRDRKGREAKPFALMTASLKTAETLVELDEVSRVEMVSWRRPIVLAPQRPDAGISARVAPGIQTLGAMLPYTPLHLILFEHLAQHDVFTLVMTSANPSDEPLCSDNSEATRRLQGIADAFLLHDRDIERRVDDSVMIAMSDPEAGTIPLRRSRGFVPEPVEVPVASHATVLAVGGDMKSTVSLLSGTRVVLSEHLGELSNPAAFRNFISTIDRFEKVLGLVPEVVAYDLHPRYQSTAHALTLPLNAIAVQHHHAHAVSCMAENGLTGRVVAIVADGTGYGPDDAVWGCEIFVTDEADFERYAHLAYFDSVGGDSFATDTWRPAASVAQACFGEDWPESISESFVLVNEQAVGLARGRLDAGAGVKTSSLGRLFDAVAFLVGECGRNRYESEAAMRLESLATIADCGGATPLSFPLIQQHESPREIDFRPAMRELSDRLSAGEPATELAAAFHEGIAAALSSAAIEAARSNSLNRIVLSGGCFANRNLLARVYERTHNHGLEVYYHRIVPTGDGGLSLGQAVCAAERMRRGRV